MTVICHVTSTPQDSIPRILRESSTAVKAGMRLYIVIQGESSERAGITFVGVRPARNRWERMLFTSRTMVREALKTGADIYQIHDPELLPYVRRFRRKGAKVVFDSHEFYGIQIRVKDYLPGFLRSLVSKTYMAYESFICRRMDAVIAVCTVNGKNYFEDRSKKTVYLPNLPNLDVFAHTDAKNRGGKAVVYLGALAESRGISNLIRAVGKTDANLVLCGRFASEAYFEYVKKLPEFIRVDYRGVVSGKVISELLQECAVGASTLLHVGQYDGIDTLPTKVYEYMAAGLPVIISDTNYAKKMLKDLEFGIAVNPGDIDDIARAVRYLLDHPDKAAEMGESGRRAVREKYNWAAEEKKLLNLYEELSGK